MSYYIKYFWECHKQQQGMQHRSTKMIALFIKSTLELCLCPSVLFVNYCYLPFEYVESYCHTFPQRVVKKIKKEHFQHFSTQNVVTFALNGDRSAFHVCPPYEFCVLQKKQQQKKLGLIDTTFVNLKAPCFASIHGSGLLLLPLSPQNNNVCVHDLMISTGTQEQRSQIIRMR